MGYLSRVQLIQRAGGTRQFYLVCPAQLAEALELEKGEQIELRKTIALPEDFLADRQDAPPQNRKLF